MKLSLILQAVDRWSAPTSRAGRATEALGRSFSPLGRRIGAARASLRAFMSDSERGERIGRRLGSTIRRVAERDFAALRRGALAARAATAGLLRNMALMGARTVGLGVGAVGAGAVAGTGFFVTDMIKNAAKFEQYQVALEGTEGSAQKARKAMAWVQKFAKDTPYDIDTVTDSFVRARGVGIDPMTGAFRILGDAAGGTRKTLMDSVEAIADAQTGEFERLKEFNITSSSKGNNVTFSWVDKAGKNASKTVKKNMKDIRQAVLSVFDQKYGGGMERQAKTLTGIWNNLQDVVTNFELSVAGKGIFDRVKSRLQEVLNWTDQLAKDGRLEAWAKDVSDELTVMFDKADQFIRETDWRSVASGIGTIASALVNVVSWIGKAASAWSNWQTDVERRQLDMTLAARDEVKVFGVGLWGTSAAQKAQARQRLNQLDINQFGRPQVRQLPGGGVQWPSDGRPAGRITNPWDTAAARRNQWQRAMQAPTGGPRKLSLDLNIKGAQPGQVQVGRMKTDRDTTINVTRGRAMGGAA